MFKCVKKAIVFYHQLKTQKRVDQFMNIIAKERQWKLDQKVLYVEEGLLDPRLDVLINVQAKLHSKATNSGISDDKPSITWEQINEVIRDEMRVVAIAQSLSKLR